MLLRGGRASVDCLKLSGTEALLDPGIKRAILLLVPAMPSRNRRLHVACALPPHLAPESAEHLPELRILVTGFADPVASEFCR